VVAEAVASVNKYSVAVKAVVSLSIETEPA